MTTEPCRICGAEARPYHTDRRGRKYVRCETCKVVFTPREFITSAEREKQEYDLHDNTDTPGYRQFLSRAARPATTHLAARLADPSATAHGLDFGCGPNPVLAKMMQEEHASIAMDVYDLYYFPNKPERLCVSESYDFITATEVVEHLENPVQVITELFTCLAVEGIIVIMTKRVSDNLEKFRCWHYIRDITHITFFHEDTFRYIAEYVSSSSGYNCHLEILGTDVVTLVKKRKDK